MQEDDIEDIQESIKILNHNSTKLTKGLDSLCRDFKSFKEVFQSHKEDYIETKTDVKIIKQMVWWMLTVIVVGTLLGIFGGVIFLFVR